MKGVDVMQSNASIEVKREIKDTLEMELSEAESDMHLFQKEIEGYQANIAKRSEAMSKLGQKINLLKSLIAELGIE